MSVLPIFTVPNKASTLFNVLLQACPAQETMTFWTVTVSLATLLLSQKSWLKMSQTQALFSK